MANKKSSKAKNNTAKKAATAKVVKVAAESTNNTNKIIAIIVAAAAIIALLLGLTCCNKDNKPEDKPKKVTKQEDKKEEEKDVIPYYNNIAEIKPVTMAFVANDVVAAIEEKDTEEPVITFEEGTEVINLEYMSDVYEELHAKYTDNVDGEGIIEKPTRITFEGNSVETIDTSVIGTYTLIYTYTDKAGNTGIATRIVNVSDNLGPNVEATKINETNYRALYSFDVTDPSGVALVKIAVKDDSIEQNEEWFESNGTELTSPYEYDIRVNAVYIIYTLDNIGNNTFFELTVDYIEELEITNDEKSLIFTVGEKTSNWWVLGTTYTKKVEINEVENITIKELKHISDKNEIDNISSDNFANADNEVGVSEMTLSYTESIFGNGDPYHYIYSKLEKTVDEVTVTDEYITPAIQPAE